MGGNGSTNRKVSFGMDEDEKVTVIEGVKVQHVLLLFLFLLLKEPLPLPRRPCFRLAELH